MSIAQHHTVLRTSNLAVTLCASQHGGTVKFSLISHIVYIFSMKHQNCNNYKKRRDGGKGNDSTGH
jgi:hypothetical protein